GWAGSNLAGVKFDDAGKVFLSDFAHSGCADAYFVGWKMDIGLRLQAADIGTSTGLFSCAKAKRQVWPVLPDRPLCGMSLGDPVSLTFVMPCSCCLDRTWSALYQPSLLVDDPCPRI